MERELKFFENLSHIQRYSGNLLIKSETVADHVIGMNALALEFVPIINEKFNLDIKLPDIIYGIALHDLDETLSTDIPRNFKYSSEELVNAIKAATDDLLRRTVPEELLKDIRYYSDHETKEGYLIKLFDVTQAGYKMLQEVELGNSFFLKELNNVIDYYGGIQADVRCLKGDGDLSIFPIPFLDAMQYLTEIFEQDLIQRAEPFGFKRLISGY